MLRKEKKKGVAIGKDLCDWWDYEKMLKKWLQYLALKEFLNISFPILLNAFIAFSWNWKQLFPKMFP